MHVKTRVSTINQVGELVNFLQELPEYETDLYIHKKMKTDEENSLLTLKNILYIFENLQNWDNESIYNSMIELAEKMQVKNGVVLWPIRTALSGQPSSPCGASEIAELIGKEETLNRINIGIKKLSKK